MTLETSLMAAAILLIICVLASKATGRLGIPTLVVFLAVGILAGTEGIGNIDFDDAKTAQSLGVIALAYILFAGGLDTKWNSIRPILKSGIALSTLAVLFTCLIVGTFTHFVLQLPFLDSFLIGAIVSSTDAGAVFTVLRSKNIHLKGNLKSLLELESGSNDPMAVFLTTAILQLMQVADFKMVDMIPLLFKQMSIGAVAGFVLGRTIVWAFNSFKLQIEGMYTVFSIALVLFIYSFTQNIGGNGFLAIYITGVVMGNHTFVLKKSLTIMHDGISWLMQSALFLTLGLLVYPTRIMQVAGPGILLASFMILIARPLSVFISLMFAKLNMREKTLISWVGLRGSVPVVMATYPLVAGLDRTGLIFNIVFFVALSSLIIQGTSIPMVSKLLKVDDPHYVKKKNYSSTPGHLNDIVIVDVPYNSPLINKTIVDLELPEQKVLIVGIERNEEVIIPRGNTTFEGGDRVSIMADDENLEMFVEKLWQPSSPPHLGLNN